MVSLEGNIKNYQHELEKYENKVKNMKAEMKV
jgi:hypothetical protein